MKYRITTLNEIKKFNTLDSKFFCYGDSFLEYFEVINKLEPTKDE